MGNFNYSPYKILQHPGKINALRNGENPYPVSVKLFLLDACNQGCKFCYYAIRDEDIQENFNYKNRLDWVTLVGLFESLSDCDVKAITFSGGGEPSAHPDFERSIEYCNFMSLDVGLITNLKLYDRIKGGQYGWVRVSLNAANGIAYEKNGQDKAKIFDEVVDNIADLSSDCDVGIGFVITEHNYKQIVDVAQLAIKTGASNVRYSLEHDGEGISFWNNIPYQTSAQIKAIIFKQFDEVEAMETESFKPYTLREKIESAEVPKQYGVCNFMKLDTLIGADGNMYPCCMLAYDANSVLGSIKYESFQDIWNGEKRAKFIKDLDVQKCPNCWFDRRNEFLEFLVDDHTYDTNMNFI